MSKTKCKFQFAFLEGEIEVDDADNELFITNISKHMKIDGKEVVVFDTTRGIMFKRSKDDLALFVPFKFIQGEKEIKNE